MGKEILFTAENGRDESYAFTAENERDESYAECSPRNSASHVLCGGQKFVVIISHGHKPKDQLSAITDR